MATRLFNGFLALVFLSVLSACTVGGSFSKALTEGSIPVEQFQSENGIFQYEGLPIGITKEEAAKRLGVESLGDPISGIGDVTSYELANRVTYEDQEVAVHLEFQGDGLTTVQFTFLSREEETLISIQKGLIQQLEELYGIYTGIQNERPPYYTEVFNWDTHLAGDLTRLSLIFTKVEQEDSSTFASLNLSVGKMVYANETS